MRPLFVRELSGPERDALQAGLRSPDGFTVRRCHILLASARGNDERGQQGVFTESRRGQMLVKR